MVAATLLTQKATPYDKFETEIISDSERASGDPRWSQLVDAAENARECFN